MLIIPTTKVLIANYSCTIKDWDLLQQRHFVLFLQGYCALQELLMKMNFTLAVASPFLHPMMSFPAMPTHLVWKYGFFSDLYPAGQMASTDCHVVMLIALAVE